MFNSYPSYHLTDIEVDTVNQYCDGGYIECDYKGELESTLRGTSDRFPIKQKDKLILNRMLDRGVINRQFELGGFVTLKITPFGEKCIEFSESEIIPGRVWKNGEWVDHTGRKWG